MAYAYPLVLLFWSILMLTIVTSGKIQWNICRGKTSAKTQNNPGSKNRCGSRSTSLRYTWRLSTIIFRKQKLTENCNLYSLTAVKDKIVIRSCAVKHIVLQGYVPGDTTSYPICCLIVMAMPLCLTRTICCYIVTGVVLRHSRDALASYHMLLYRSSDAVSSDHMLHYCTRW